MRGDDDMNDSLEDIFGGAPAAPRPEPKLPEGYKPVEQRITEGCDKCRGSGNWRPGYPCFKCGGTGKLTFKTPRDRARQGYHAKAAAKVAEANQARSAWIEAHPAVMAWIKSEMAKAQPFEFAIAMEEAIGQYGRLTDNQLAACERIVAKRAAAKAEREAAAPTVTVDRLTEAFDKAQNYKRLAHQKGVRNLQLRLDTFIFKPARKHPGTIYVTDREETGVGGEPLYLGKIVGGRFLAVRATGADREARIVAAIADPAKAAVAYGQRFGVCSCCGADLTNAESIRLGIGPICREKFGW